MYDELIKRLRNCLTEVNCTGCDCNNSLIKQAADAIERLDAIAETYVETVHEIEDRRKWIPVTKRLPEIHTNVLVVDNANDMAVGSLEKIWDSIVWVCPFSAVDDEDCEITHWMPLPQAPESEDE